MSNQSDATDAAVRAVIRSRRAAMNLSLDDLAERAEIPRSTLKRYLHGDSRLVFGTVRALADALNISLEQLVRDAEELIRQGLVPVDQDSLPGND